LAEVHLIPGQRAKLADPQPVPIGSVWHCLVLSLDGPRKPRLDRRDCLVSAAK
jgi:hypothetical protein